jgi:glycerol dehydrogenase-like iron-containing ADH family enzyme
MHGEKVNFGTLTQFALEDRPTREYNEFVSFCMSVGLPTTFADLDLANVSKEELETVAKAATAPGETIHNMPFAVTPGHGGRRHGRRRLLLARLPAGVGAEAGNQRPLMP